MKVKIDPRRKKKGPKLKIMLAPIEDGQGTKSAISSTRVCRCVRLGKYAVQRFNFVKFYFGDDNGH